MYIAHKKDKAKTHIARPGFIHRHVVLIFSRPSYQILNDHGKGVTHFSGICLQSMKCLSYRLYTHLCDTAENSSLTSDIQVLGIIEVHK